jgi:hypothetical protein
LTDISLGNSTAKAESNRFNMLEGLNQIVDAPIITPSNPERWHHFTNPRWHSDDDHKQSRGRAHVHILTQQWCEPSRRSHAGQRGRNLAFAHPNPGTGLLEAAREERQRRSFEEIALRATT